MVEPQVQQAVCDCSFQWYQYLAALAVLVSTYFAGRATSFDDGRREGVTWACKQFSEIFSTEELKNDQGEKVVDFMLEREKRLDKFL